MYADGPVEERVLLPDGETWHNIVNPEKTKVAETLDEFRGRYKCNCSPTTGAGSSRAPLRSTSGTTTR